MKRWFGDINLNLIFRIVAGKRFVEGDTAEGERCRKSLRDFFELMGVFTVGEAVPFLRRLDLGGYEKAMKKTAKELDGVLQGWLEEHKHKRISGEAKAEQDFMDVLLSVLLDGGVTQEGPKFDADTINKATCLNLLTCKQIEGSTVHHPSSSSKGSGGSAKLSSSCSSIFSFKDVVHGNTSRVVHRADNSPEGSTVGKDNNRLLTRKATAAAGVTGSASNRSLSSSIRSNGGSGGGGATFTC
ncbi:hypothetical protein LOK49_LG05G02289 [Camellia lanceoleosa]|uniref:Uncharacterized protein n=1 Tax=Camellia lanceoleosa TaxID=1840588 RepID=A0ACC0HT71_9ERIC|nr:hypothetical protein LOK49_LG05G02289 [Camellia lanceoleosa]